MELESAEGLAHALMIEHGISERWTFVFDNAIKRMGSCNYRARRISISSHFTLHASEAQVKDTILHEIAHALTPHAKHGLKWKAMAMKLGANPKACGENPFVDSPDEVAKRLAVVEGKEYVRVNHPSCRAERYRVLRENAATFTLIDDEGREVRVSKSLVFRDGTSAPTPAEARAIHQQANLARVAGAPVFRVRLSAYANKKYGVIRRGNGRTRSLLVDLETGSRLRVPDSHLELITQ